MSTTMRSDGAGGQIHSFCAMNSFSMSFWMVPPSWVQGTPCSSATARYMARSALAEQLTVIEAVTRSRRTPLKSARMSARLETATPSRQTSPSARECEAGIPLGLCSVPALEPLALRHRRLRGRSGTKRAGFARRHWSTSFCATGSQSSDTSTRTRRQQPTGTCSDPPSRARTARRVARGTLTTCASGGVAEVGLERMSLLFLVEPPQEEEPRTEVGREPSREGRLADSDRALDRDEAPRGPVRRHPPHDGELLPVLLAEHGEL